LVEETRVKILGSNMFGPNNLLLKQDDPLLAGIGVLGLYPDEISNDVIFVPVTPSHDTF